MGKRILTLVLLTTLVFGGLFTTEVKLSTAYPGGDGTINDPYKVSTPDDLNNIRNNLNSHFVLTQNIDLSGFDDWDPIGNSSSPFTGSFDGKHYIIENLTINKEVAGTNESVGLFGYIYKPALLENIVLRNANVVGGKFIGPLVGYNQGGIICRSSSTNGLINGYSDVGGLVGVHNNNGLITDSFSTGTVTAASINIGGLVGISFSSGENIIQRSYSTADVVGNNTGDVGGLVGDNAGIIRDSYATGNVSNGENVGGLVGLNQRRNSTAYGQISNSFSTGTVTGPAINIGGLVGVKEDDTVVENSFWDINTSGQNTSDGGEGKTTEEMKNETTFTNAGWNLNDVWLIEDDYPYLKKPLTISGSFSVDDKFYDGTTSASITTNNLEIVGVNGTDDINISWTASFTDPNIGVNKTVKLKNSSINGIDATKYILLTDCAPTTTADINEITLTDNLLTYWSFDEGLDVTLGEKLEEAGFSLVKSSSSDGPSLDQYKGREAVRFDRSKDQYLLTESKDIEILNTSTASESFSYMAWYYVTEMPSIDRYFVMETSVDYPLSYGLRKDGEYKGQVFTDSDDFYLDGSNGYGANEGQWYNIIVTYDSSEQKHIAYLNGQKSGEMIAQVTNDLLGLVIGSYRENDGRYFNGYIDDVAIWERVLSSDEISLLQEMQISGEHIYNVSYNGNENTGGQVPIDSGVYEEGTEVIASENVNDLTKTGYTFSEWNTKANGSGLSYAPGESFIRHNSDITLYAQWEINEYKITFDSDGGTSVDPIIQNFNTEIAIPSNPVKQGYNFAGWDPEVPESMPENDMTITAIWEPRDDTEYTTKYYKQNLNDNEYVLFESYVLEGTTDTEVSASVKDYTGFVLSSTTGSGIIAPDGSLVLEQFYDREEFTVKFKDYNGSDLKTETVRYEGMATAPDEPTREGYIFTGWDESFNNVNKDIITTAQYDTGEYKVSFDTNGGSSINNQALDYNSLVIEPEDPVKLGYTFISWYKSELYSEEWDFNNDKVPADDITIYANWEPRDDIEYRTEHYQQNLDNDEYTLIEYEVLEGTTNEEVTASIKDYQGFNDPTTIASGVILGDSSLVLKQYYDRSTYNVKFLDKDGEEFKSEIVKHNGKVSLSEAPTRDNHRFAGWYKNEGLSDEFSLSESITKDLIIYPKWTRVIIIENNNSSKNSDLPILINGEKEKAGKERIVRKFGKRSAEITLDTSVIKKKIKAMKDDAGEEGSKNMIEIPVISQNLENIKTILTGDIVKTMSDDNFDLSIKTSNVNYVFPAKEVGIESVAKQLGVSTDKLEDIEINIDISYPDAELGKEIEDSIIKEGYEIVSRPISFEIIAKAKTVAGESKQITISRFNQFIQRTIKVSKNDNDKKISTGVIYDNHGNLLHVPTYIYVEDGVYYARINSLTNSSYTLIWNQKSKKLGNDHWAKEAIDEMYSRLVIKKAEGFNPDGYITRGEVVKYITSALGLYNAEANYENIFPDINSSDELYELATLAREYGLIKGYPDTTFREDRLISKEEAMVIFARVMDLINLEKNNETANTHSADIQGVASWAINDIEKVINAEIFNMSGNSKFSPKEKLTHAEMINTLRNLLIKSKLINK